MIDKEAIFEAALRLQGVPYHHQGRIEQGVVDCVGLLIAVCKAVGAQWHDFTNYSPFPDGHTLTAELAKSLDAIPVASAVPGDVLVFKIGSLPRHIGISLPADQLIHTHREVGKVVVHRIGETWTSRRHDTAYRLREVV